MPFWNEKKKNFVSKVSKGNIFLFLNLVFCLEDFRVNVSEFSVNSSKTFLSLKGIAKFKLTLQLPSVLVLFFCKFLLCYKYILPTSIWLIEHFPLTTTKIPHDEWLALKDPKGMNMMIFFRAWSYKYSLAECEVSIHLYVTVYCN